MWTLTQAWYGDRLRPDYRPADLATLQGRLAAAGLNGDFWELR